MKNILIVISLLLLMGSSLKAQIAINTDGSDADASAILDVKSSQKGFLPPRMTEVQMNAISNPVEGLIVYCTDCNPKSPYYYDGNLWLSFSANSISFSDIVNPTTGKIWMDRNLGASRVATSSTDSDAYGDLYQWGRSADGHEKRNSGITSSLSNSDTPGHSDYINNEGYPYDWRSPQNGDLWQGANGTNNPCPSGYRLPTDTELNNERLSWSTNNATGAYASPLKFVLAGRRGDGSLTYVGSSGNYWSSTIHGTGVGSYSLNIASSPAFIDSYARTFAFSVRCIKN